MRLALLLVALPLASCSDVSVGCASFSTWEACPIEQGCGWGHHGDGTWRCVTPCESDDDCNEGTCREVGGAADQGMNDVNVVETFDACVE